MNNVIKIGCPICGAVLKVAAQAGIEEKKVTCPVCHTTSPYKNFKPIVDNNEPTHYNDDTARESGAAIGRLVVPSLGASYALTKGRNVIGRKSPQSSASIQIPFPAGQKRTSREHLVIDVKHVEGRGYVHYVSLFKEKVNATFVGAMPLEYGDSVVLRDKDIIRLPDLELRFEIPDEDGTEL